MLQDKYENYTKTEICNALLELCPPDSAMLLKSHQDKQSQAQNRMTSMMCPGMRPFKAWSACLFSAIKMWVYCRFQPLWCATKGEHGSTWLTAYGRLGFICLPTFNHSWSYDSGLCIHVYRVPWCSASRAGPVEWHTLQQDKEPWRQLRQQWLRWV